MEKLKFIKATAFPDKNNPKFANFQPAEILVPVEAIACLLRNPNGHNSYQVIFRADYPFSLAFQASSVSATLDISKIEIL